MTALNAEEPLKRGNSSTHVHLKTVVLADLGYLGLERLHVHTYLPVKVTKYRSLTQEEKKLTELLPASVFVSSKSSVVSRASVFFQSVTEVAANVLASAVTSSLAPITLNFVSALDFIVARRAEKGFGLQARRWVVERPFA